MRMHFLLPVLIALFFWQCDSGDTAATQATDSPPAAEQPSTPPQDNSAANAVPTSPYPSITEEMMMNLFNNCDYIDFVFYNTNFSMSQNQQGAIRNTLASVSTQPAQVLSTCKPVGRLFFQIEGENAEEADLFYGGNCLYYLFLKNGTYAYGNQLTESGYAFYQKIFAQAAAAGGQ